MTSQSLRTVGACEGPFDQLVFSGGGLRCLWQGGFLHVVRAPLGLEPKRVIGVSGGALSASGFLAHCGEDILDRFKRLGRETRHNIHARPLENERLTPHQRAYRQVVSDCLSDARQATIAKASHFQIFLGRPPAASWPTASGTLAALTYQLELKTRASPHFTWPERLGVSGFRVDARDAARRGTLADLVCAAAVIPPIFEPPLWQGQPVIDGGMADQAPMPEPDRGQTLVLLTRHYRGLKPKRDRLYVDPSADVPVDKIDFTDPELMQMTWEQGLQDGERFLRG